MSAAVKSLLQQPGTNGAHPDEPESLDHIAEAYARALRLKQQLRAASGDITRTELDRSFLFAAYVATLAILGEIVDPLGVLLEKREHWTMGTFTGYRYKHESAGNKRGPEAVSEGMGEGMAETQS